MHALKRRRNTRKSEWCLFFGAAPAFLVLFLRDDVQVYVRSGCHEALDGEEVEILLEALERGAAEDGLSDPVLCGVGSGGDGDVGACQANDIGAEVAGELQIFFESSHGFRLLIAWRVKVQNMQLSVGGMGVTGAASYQISCSRAGADTDCNFFCNSPMCAELFAVNVFSQGAVYGAGDAMQRHLSEGDEIAAAEEVGHGTLYALLRVDIAAAHAGGQSFRGKVADDDFIGTIEDPIRHSFTDLDAGE